MSLLEKKLTKAWAEEVIPEKSRLISAIIFDLQEMGKKLAAELDLKDYESLDQFLDDHDKGKSPLDRLEGKADREDNVFILKKCPLVKLVESLKGPDGKLPKYYLRVGEKYMEIYKTKTAILHPFCIVHQVIRSIVGEHIKIKDKPMHVYQIACRSIKGKVVCASEGMTRIKMKQEEVEAKIDGMACMYMLKP
ncbi:MAG TPA: hypothetical protein VJM83_02870 [Nitrospirota bacterium]|nr:hypothetical protein [Nitrospirota bacterium]